MRHYARAQSDQRGRLGVSTALLAPLLLLMACDGGSSTAVEEQDGPDGRFRGDFTVRNQADLEQFSEAGYTRIEGHLIIDGSALTDLDGLSTLREVTSNVVVSNNPELVDVAGLANLQSVSGSLRILANPVLQGLPQFTDLESVALGIVIGGNDLLLEVVGFNALMTTELLAVNFNSSLARVDGFEALTMVDGPSSGTGRGLYQFVGNPSLETIGGFGKLVTTGEFDIVMNPMLDALPEYPELKEIQTNFNIYENRLASIRGFGALEAVGNSFTINDAPDLTDISGFGQLADVGGDFTLMATRLPDLSAFRSLTSGLTGDLRLIGNVAMSDISGLNGLGDALSGGPIIGGDFIIRLNESLGDSTAYNLLSLLEDKYEEAAVEGSIDIGDNDR